MAVDKSLLTGSMTMLILKLLSEKDMYGYEMIDTLRRRVLYILFCMGWRKKECSDPTSRKFWGSPESITVLPNKDVNTSK